MTTHAVDKKFQEIVNPEIVSDNVLYLQALEDKVTIEKNLISSLQNYAVYFKNPSIEFVGPEIENNPHSEIHREDLLRLKIALHNINMRNNREISDAQERLGSLLIDIDNFRVKFGVRRVYAN